MKRIIKFVFLICLFAFSIYVYAGETQVHNMNIVADILENGDMQVTETIKFEISGELNGLYRDILLSSKDKYGASELKVIAVKVDNRDFVYSSQQLSNGTDGKYNINNISDGKQIKIFVPSYDEIRTVEITYILKDVILVYNDIAELHWNFIGSEWDNGMQNVNITINLPNTSNELRAWGHGPLNGIVSISSKDKIDLHIDGLNYNTEVTARVTFDNTLITGATKTYNENGLENILKEEENYTDYANKVRFLSKCLIYALITSAILFVICPIVWYFVKKKEFEKADFNGIYYRELPEDYGPAVMAELLGAITISELMSACLMNMTRLGVISITEIKNTKNAKKNDYLIKLLTDKKNIEEMNNISDNEKYLLLNMLFTENTHFTLEELKKRFKKSSEQSTATLKCQTWLKKIKEDARKYELYKDNYRIAKGCVWFVSLPVIICLILIVLGFVFTFDDIIGFSMITLILGLCVIAIAASEIHSKIRLTKKGVNHKAKWKAFSKFLDDFSKMEDYPVQSLVLWEHYLVYAVALGKAKTVIKQLQIMYPTELSDNNQDLLNTYSLLYFCRNNNAFSEFNKTFNSAMSSAFTPQSSGSGSGGGFSGGGGSGGGGGGGGRLLKTKFIRLTKT